MTFTKQKPRKKKSLSIPLLILLGTILLVTVVAIVSMDNMSPRQLRTAGGETYPDRNYLNTDGILYRVDSYYQSNGRKRQSTRYTIVDGKTGPTAQIKWFDKNTKKVIRRDYFNEAGVRIQSAKYTSLGKLTELTDFDKLGRITKRIEYAPGRVETKEVLYEYQYENMGFETESLSKRSVYLFPGTNRTLAHVYLYSDGKDKVGTVTWKRYDKDRLIATRYLKNNPRDDVGYKTSEIISVMSTGEVISYKNFTGGGELRAETEFDSSGRVTKVKTYMTETAYTGGADRTKFEAGDYFGDIIYTYYASGNKKSRLVTTHGGTKKSSYIEYRDQTSSSPRKLKQIYYYEDGLNEFSALGLYYPEGYKIVHYDEDNQWHEDRVEIYNIQGELMERREYFDGKYWPCTYNVNGQPMTLEGCKPYIYQGGPRSDYEPRFHAGDEPR